MWIGLGRSSWKQGRSHPEGIGGRPFFGARPWRSSGESLAFFGRVPGPAVNHSATGPPRGVRQGPLTSRGLQPYTIFGREAESNLFRRKASR